MYVSCFLSDTIEEQLFQIAHCYKYKYAFNKKPVFLKSASKFVTPKLISEEDFKSINFKLVNEDSTYTPEDISENICLIGFFKDIEYFSNNIRNKMIEFIYENEDYMYDAYDILKSIKNEFKDQDDNNYAYLYIYNNPDYNFINNALKNINAKYIIIITDNNDFQLKTEKKIKYVESINDNIKIILMSFLNKGIIDTNDSLIGWWGSYIGNNNKEIFVSNNLDKKLYLNNWTIS